MNKKKTRNSAGPGTGGGPGSSRPIARGATNKEPSGIREANRPVSSSPSRNSGHASNSDQDSGEKEGIYSNIRLTHACTCLIGATVTVNTKDGSSFEGLFRVFSPNLEITLEQAHLVDSNDPTKIDPGNVRENVVFRFDEIVSVSACDVDLEYAAKDGFQTDTQISGKHNGDSGTVRELEKWEPDDLEMDNDGDLGESAANGWSAEEMFKRNEEEYGVQSTFKENLEGYTVQLDSVKNTDEYKEREARAKQVARELEATSTAVELENGDEEEAFSAVQRGPNHRGEDGGSGKYVTPARRQSSGGTSGSGGKPQHINTGNVRQPTQRSTPPPHDRERRNDMRGNQRLSIERDYHHHGGHHSGRDQHPSRGGCGRGGAQMHDNRRDMQPNRRSGGGGGNFGMKGEHMTGPPQSMPHRGPPPMGGMHRQGQKSQSDQVSDLREFGDNFHLAPANQGPPPQSGDRNYQQYHGGKQHSPKGHLHGDANRGASRSPPNSAPPPSKASSPPTPGAQEQKRFSPPSTATAAHIPVASINQKQEQEISAPPTPAVATSAPAEISAPPPTSSTASSTPASIAKKSSLNPLAGEFVFNPKPAANVRPPSASPHQHQRSVTPATSHPGVPSPAVQHMPYNPQFAAPVYMAGPFAQQGIVHNAGPGGSPYPQPFPGAAGAPQIASPLQQQHLGQQQQTQVRFQRGPGNGGPGNGSIPGNRQPPIQGANESAAANIAAATGQPLVAPAQNPSPMASQANNEQSQQHNLAANFGHYVMTPQMMAATNHLVRLPQGVVAIPGNGVNPMAQVQPNTSSGVGPIPPQHVQENSGSVSLPPMASQGPGVPWIPANHGGQPNIPPPPTGQPPPHNPANSAPPQGPPPNHPAQGNGAGGQPGSGGGNGNTPAQSPGPLLIPHPQQAMFSNSPAAATYQMHVVPFHNPAAPGPIHPQHTIITSQAAGQHQQPITSIAGQIPPPMYHHHYALQQQHGPAQGMLGQHNSPFLIHQIHLNQQTAGVQQQQPPSQWGANFEDQTQPSNSSYPPSPPISTENPSSEPPSDVADGKEEVADVEAEAGRSRTPESPSSNHAVTQDSFAATNSDSSCKIMSLPEESPENSTNVAGGAAVMHQHFISPNTAFYSAPQQCFAPFPITPVLGQLYPVAPAGSSLFTSLAINGQFPPPQLPHYSCPGEVRPSQDDADVQASPTDRKSPQVGKKHQTDTAPSVTPNHGGRITSPPNKQQRRFMSGPPPGLMPHPSRSPYSPLAGSPRSLWPTHEERNFQGHPGVKHQGLKSSGSYGGGNRYDGGDRHGGKVRNFSSNQQPGFHGRKTTDGPTALNVLSIPSAIPGGPGNLPIHSPRKSKGRT